MHKQANFLYVCEHLEDKVHIINNYENIGHLLICGYNQCESMQKPIKVNNTKYGLEFTFQDGTVEKHFFVIKDRDNEYWYHTVSGMLLSYVKFVSGSYNHTEIMYLLSRVTAPHDGYFDVED